MPGCCARICYVVVAISHERNFAAAMEGKGGVVGPEVEKTAVQKCLEQGLSES
jgi:hypothetical protein